MPRKLLIHGEKNDYVVTVPDDAKVTFGPFAPPGAGGYRASGGSPVGTLRVYKGAKTTENVMAVFSPVRGFRDLSLDYEEVDTKPTEVLSLPWSDLSEAEKEELAEIVMRKAADRATEKEEDDPFPL